MQLVDGLMHLRIKTHKLKIHENLIQNDITWAEKTVT